MNDPLRFSLRVSILQDFPQLSNSIFTKNKEDIRRVSIASAKLDSFIRVIETRRDKRTYDSRRFDRPSKSQTINGIICTVIVTFPSIARRSKHLRFDDRMKDNAIIIIYRIIIS